MKVNSRIYKGIEYIQLNDLPDDQQQKLRETLSEDSLIKILIDKNIISNCLQYKYYEVWFDSVFVRANPRSNQRLGAPVVELVVGKV